MCKSFDFKCSDGAASFVFIFIIREGVGCDSSVGKATLYVLDGAGMESVPVAERSKARACGRWLAGVAGSNPARGHGCLCCTYRQKAKCRIIKTKRTKNDEVQTIREYKKKKFRCGHGCFALCVLYSADKNTNASTIQKKKQVRLKYKEREQE